jgi:two-component system, NarL family, invasion response regulator UvrY
MIKVLIVDDHAILREGMRKIIQCEPEIEVAGSVSSASEAINHLSSTPVDVVILDISMPGRSGLDVIKDIKKIQPDAAILMLSMYSEERFAVRALKTGASGYLTKDMATEELITAIRVIHNGRKYITPALAETMANSFQEDTETTPHESLSDREFEVMRMIAAGKSIHEIAEILSLSSRTVSTYRTRILQKMNLPNNARIMQYAITNGLVDNN